MSSTDQAASLDHSPHLEFDPKGQGVALARSCLNLEFMEPGNKVRVKLPIVVQKAPWSQSVL